MQTFLPYPDFAKSARVLDMRRLGKQIEEVWQIYNAARYGGGWRNHPAVLMWREHLPALLAYGESCADEWERRGYRCRKTSRKIRRTLTVAIKLKHSFWLAQRFDWPDWIFWPRFIRAHRSNLLRKKLEYYRALWPKLTPDLPYVWPTQQPNRK